MRNDLCSFIENAFPTFITLLKKKTIPTHLIFYIYIYIHKQNYQIQKFLLHIYIYIYKISCFHLYKLF